VLDIPVEFFQRLDHLPRLTALGQVRFGVARAGLLGGLEAHQAKLRSVQLDQPDPPDAVGQVAGVFLHAVELLAI